MSNKNYDWIPQEIREIIIWKTDKKQEGDPDEIVGYRTDPMCKDCGKVLDEPRVIRMSISHSQAHHTHIKSICNGCKLYKNPVTGVFDCDFHSVNRHFLRRKKDSD